MSEFFQSDTLIAVFLIFLIRVASIAIATVRLLLMNRAHDLIVVTLSFVEVLAFALTFGAVAQNLNDIPNLISYCLGFAVGTWVGMWIERYVVGGFANINVISTGKSQLIAEAIREAGYGATRTSAEGSSGTVGLVWVVAQRKDAPCIIGIAQRVDAKAFVTVGEARSVMHGFFNPHRS